MMSHFIKKSSFILLLLFLVSAQLHGQDYSIESISPNLREDAYAIVRNSSKKFVQIDANNGTYKVNYTITILNSNGDDYAHFQTYEDSFQELKSFSGEIYNASGKSIKKIGKKDLSSTALSSHLATDDKLLYYSVHVPTYPFTIKFEYEKKFKNGILIYPTFFPAFNYHVAVEQADYTLQVPSNSIVREKIIQDSLINIIPPTQNANNIVYSYNVNQLKALPYERFAPFDELFPCVYLTPENFCASGICGNLSSWEKFGEWIRVLLKDRNQLPPKTLAQIHELTEGLVDNREKVKILYEYLQKNTHYVSIQLGIGGWQPMKAEEVAKTGFGDCKALSNYMKSMLDAVDIPSYYTIISSTNKEFFVDYPNFTQADHVILMVPLEKDTVWLECTSQHLPFGYIHSNIAGHDALAVGDEAVLFHRLPDYSLHENYTTNTIETFLSPMGDATFNIHSHYALGNFQSLFHRLKGLTRKEENDLLASLWQVHKPEVSDFRKEENLSERPELDIYYTVKCEEYANKTNSRMLIPISPTKKLFGDFLTGNSRRFDIEIKNGFNQTDSVIIHIPENYFVEKQPSSVEISSQYGSFKRQIKEENNTLIYTQSLIVKPGRYKASDFDDVKQFYKKLADLQTNKLSLKKTENTL